MAGVTHEAGDTHSFGTPGCTSCAKAPYYMGCSLVMLNQLYDLGQSLYIDWDKSVGVVIIMIVDF